MNSSIEDRGRAPKPDVGLRVHPLEAESVQDFLGAHVQPAHVDVRMMALEVPFQQLQLIPAMGRIKNNRSAMVGRAGGKSGKSGKGDVA